MNPQEENSTGLIVLGMHRSGTSLLTRLLSLSGAWLGEEEEISAKGDDNPTGFWENSSVKSINQCLLEAVGSDWDDTSHFDLWSVPPGIDTFLRQQAMGVTNRLRQHRIWAVKDPRLCLVLPWWQPIFGNIVVMHCVRSPLDIAHSLKQRNGFPISLGIALWEFYQRSALRVSTGLPAISIAYDDLVNDPVEGQASLAKQARELLGLELGVITPEVLQDFVSKDLRHSCSSQEATRIALSDEQWLLYQDMRQGRFSQASHSSLSARTAQELLHHGSAKAEKVGGPGLLATNSEISDSATLRELGIIRKELKLLHRIQSEGSARIRALEGEVKRGFADSVDLQNTNQFLCNENKALSRWLGDVFHQLELTKNSVRWKVGDRLVRAIEIGLFRPRPRLAMTVLDEIRQQYEAAMQHGGIGNALLHSGLGMLADSRSAPTSLDFIVFPIIDWHFRIQRPQQLSRELAKAGHRVFYLSLLPGLGAAEPVFEITEKPGERTHLVDLMIPEKAFPNPYKERLQPQLVKQLVDALSTLYSECQIANPVAIVDLAFWSPVALALPGTPVVYDCMDHHGGFSTATHTSNKLESELIDGCDLLVVTSRWLWKKYENVDKKCLVPNAGEIEFFATVPEHPVKFGSGPVVGYIGAIADWFDVQLVAEAARRRPDVTFVLVGSTDFCDTKPLLRLPNVKLVGEVPYSEVPRYLHAFDCCFIPFLLTELIQATNPVKVYEYLAAGKPVVATKLPELEPISGLVHLAANSQEFVSLIDVALAERNDISLAKSRAAWASGHDWSSRCEALLGEIGTLFPRVSVVVLCYNNLDFTESCIDSLRGPGAYPNLELICVDNGSTDGTGEYLGRLGETFDNIKVILNGENLGFAAGNNVGIKAASGDFIILLNNDTFGTPGWIFGLIRHLRENSSIGLVGPVTNNIGNEAKLDIDYHDMKSMFTESFKHTSANRGNLLSVPTIAFFCVGFSRDLVDQVGLLDEQFGQGFFEDDDYCRRVTEEGYKIVIAEDVFVHHHLSATFSRENAERRERLFEENKKKYEAKWGKWKPHVYRQ
jgi:GT2 family glycosyltransferase/glycosyltransferase involved in cell wall biosynthesis